MISSVRFSTFNTTPPAPPSGGPTPPPAEKEGFIRTVVEGGAGIVGGAIGAVLHTPAGALEGLAEGLTSNRGEGSTGMYHAAMFLECVGGGALTGALLGGPPGAVVGAVVGLALDGLNALIEHRGEVPGKFVAAVEDAVDKAVAKNTDGSKVKIAVQNATEGIIVGTGLGFKGGWQVGFDAGRGVAGGFIDVGEGILQGIRDAFSHKK